MTVRAETSTPRPAISLPHDAVQLLDERPVVFLAQPDGKGGAKFIRRDVETGATVDGRTHIANGLAAGDVVVTDGAFAVKSQFSRAQDAGGLGASVMIERLIAAALRFRVAVIASVWLLVAAGTWALANLTVDAFPDLTPNQVRRPDRRARAVAERGREPRELSRRDGDDGPAAHDEGPVDLQSRHLGRHGLVRRRRRPVLRAGAGAAADAGRDRSPARAAPSDARSGGDADGRGLSVSRRIRFASR